MMIPCDNCNKQKILNLLSSLHLWLFYFLKRNCKQIRKHFQGDRHCFSQASMLAKLLALPLHPPKTKTSHLPDSLLKKYRSKAALQGPTSAGKWQSGLSTDFLEEETPLPPQKLSHFSLEAKLFPLPSQPPYSNVWQAPFWGLKCHLWRLARQFPVSGFKSHISRKRKKKGILFCAWVLLPLDSGISLIWHISTQSASFKKLLLFPLHPP